MTCDVTLHAQLQHGTSFTNREVSSDITDCDRGPPELLPCLSFWPSFLYTPQQWHYRYIGNLLKGGMYDLWCHHACTTCTPFTNREAVTDCDRGPPEVNEFTVVTMATKLVYHVVHGDITSHASHLLKTLLTYIIPLLVFTNIIGPPCRLTIVTIATRVTSLHLACCDDITSQPLHKNTLFQQQGDKLSCTNMQRSLSLKSLLSNEYCVTWTLIVTMAT